MKLSRWKELFRRDAWLYGALAFCVALGLLLSGMHEGTGQEERQIAQVLSQISGAGDVSVAIYREEDKPCGAIIVSSGAQDVSIRLQLQQAAQTLLGLPASRIGVYPRQGGVHP